MAESTRFHNIDLIKKDLGYQQVGNSTLFVKTGKYLLSPSVSAGEAGSYWIDIRQANLEQIPDRTQCDFLIRIVPDMFCLCKLSAIRKLLSPALMDNRPNSGNVWGIKLEIKKFKKTVEIRSNRDMMNSVTVPLLDKEEVIRSFKK
ncbi:MAG TPA: hypothetical protein VFC65_13805 [Prolixibacteraceae bacterium]|nr:hypothetical protein [Prolixibacteraceae bacterium]